MSLVSDAGEKALRELLDRQQIADLIHRYCRAVDRIDEDLGHSIFHPGATADYGEFYQGSGYGAIDAVCQSHRGCLAHSHQITTTTIVIDEDRASSEAYHFAVVRMMAGEALTQVTVWGRYLDRWSRKAGGWGIEHRQVVRDFDEIRVVTPLTPGLTPRRDTTCPSYALFDPRSGSRVGP